MRYLIIIMCVLGLVGCKPKNDQSTLDLIFDKPQFQMYLEYSGCFAYGKEVFTFKKAKNGYFILCESTGKNYCIPVSDMEKLRLHCDSLKGKSFGSLCNSLDKYIRIGTICNQISFTQSCLDEEEDVLDQITHYSALMN